MFIRLNNDGNVVVIYICDRCEFDRRQGRCVPGVCRNGGTCHELSGGGFRCECPSRDYERPYCTVTARSFPPKSFIMFRGLRQRFHLSISLTVRESWSIGSVTPEAGDRSAIRVRRQGTVVERKGDALFQPVAARAYRQPVFNGAYVESSARAQARRMMNYLEVIYCPTHRTGKELQRR
ncbi:cadherin EGF LAG seven-pass G-type receptor 3 [Lates japonicus]|uniref:Cadherin EGF LAG seven-pass G-type receptor 3 n=1 Tax=Lates japonicus TaxID=270547 RepID=A0AAD3MFJ5_LATJO|nr:cadherin EGF LAG seven-pass G-type receptor 3 [Lates japonicus]